MLSVKKGIHLVADQIKCFFRQTFRRHTGAEYTEVVTRGVKRSNQLNRQYPWVYIRLFAAIFILFAVFLLVIRFTANELFAPTVMMLGAVVFSIPFLALLYEIYPRCDLSLIVLFVAMLIGATCASVITQVVYSFIDLSDDWILALSAGLVEELSKAVVTFIIIEVVKNKQPLVGFLLGAAVGCGFSIVEDFGYIFVYSNQVSAVNLSTAIDMLFSRGVSTFCTHIVWTACIGWAYSAFPRRFLSGRFYLILALNIALHVFWDAPLEGALGVTVIAVCASVAAVEGIAILYRGRKRIFASGGEEPTPDFFAEDRQSLDKKTPQYYTHIGHLCLTVAAFLMAVVAVVYCTIPFRESVYTKSFNSPQEFVAFVQNDRELPADGARQFDASLPDGNNIVVKENDEVVRVTQMVEEGDVTYYYVYNVAGGRMLLYDIYAEFVENGVMSKYLREELYDENGKIYAAYFMVRGDVVGTYFTGDGRAVAIIQDVNFERDLSRPQYAILFYVFAGLAGSAIALYIVFYVKSRRIKNVE